MSHQHLHDDTTGRYVLDIVMKFEVEGFEDDRDALESFAYLIRTGAAWNLQGVYGRTAHHLIAQHLLTPEGELTDYAIDQCEMEV